MTCLDWGCDPLREECESCLDALCNACTEEFKKPGNLEAADGPEGACPDSREPDCDRYDLEKKPDCKSCEIILGVCLKCGENRSCEFRING
jgi:hypothetical protein